MKRSLFWMQVVVLVVSLSCFSNASQQVHSALEGAICSSEPMHWQRQTQLQHRDVLQGLHFSRELTVHPESVFALRTLGLEYDAVARHLRRLYEISDVLREQVSREHTLDELAASYAVDRGHIDAWVELGASPEELLILLHLDAVSSESLLAAGLIEARRIPWSNVRASILENAREMGLVFSEDTATLEEMAASEFTIRTSSSEYLTNPATGYDSDKLNPFQAYFGSFSESVNPATGALTIRHTDFVLPGKGGFDFELTRVYSSNRANLYNQYGMVIYVEGEPESEELYIMPHTYLDRFYHLGVGWSFGFPSIELDAGLLHMGDGRVFGLDSSSPSGLANHPVEDMVFGSNASGMELLLKNGRMYQFGFDGRLLYIEDRYENQIQFGYDMDDRVSEIEDTVGRLIRFDYSICSKVIVRIEDENQQVHGTMEYHISGVPGHVGDPQTWFPNKKQLDKVVDFVGRELEYTYDVIDAEFYFDFQSGGTPASPGTNYYLAMTKIQHPLGSETRFTWETPLPRKAWMDPLDPSESVSIDDYQEYIRIAWRSDYNNQLQRFENYVGYDYQPWCPVDAVFSTEQTQYSSDQWALAPWVTTDIRRYNDSYQMVENKVQWAQLDTYHGDIDDAIYRERVQSISYSDYGLPVVEETRYSHEVGIHAARYYAYDQYGNLLYDRRETMELGALSPTTISKKVYEYYDEHYHLPKWTQELVDEDTDAWYTIDYLASDSVNITRADHQELQSVSVVGLEEEYDIAGSGNLRPVNEWVFGAYDVSEVSFDLFVRAGSLNRTISWNVAYRRVDASDSSWVTYDEDDLQGNFWSANEDTISFAIPIPAEGFWEVRVQAVSGSIRLRTSA